MFGARIALSFQAPFFDTFLWCAQFYQIPRPSAVYIQLRCGEYQYIEPVQQTVENCPADGFPFDIRDHHGENCSDVDCVLNPLLRVKFDGKMETGFYLAVDNALNRNIEDAC